MKRLKGLYLTGKYVRTEKVDKMTFQRRYFYFDIGFAGPIHPKLVVIFVTLRWI